MERIRKRVMILGANDLVLPLIQRAKNEGHYTIVVSPKKDEPGFEYADFACNINVLDKEAVLSVARDLKIDGIITDQAEAPIRTVAYVAENLGLPGIGTETAELFTNKYLQRKKCQAIGIDTIRFKLVNNQVDALNFFETLSGDAIMKPIDSAGSRGVVRVRQSEDIEKHFNYTLAASGSGQVIVEDYIEGKELMIDGVVVNNTFQTLVCGEYHKCKMPGVFSAYMGKYPADLTSDELKMVNDFVKTAIEGFGLSFGRTHTEVKINKKGVWLMETAARGGGRHISSCVVPLMTDFSSEKFLLEACLGEVNEVPCINRKKVTCGYIAMFIPPGKIISVDGLKDALDKPYTSMHNMGDIHVGMETGQFTDKTDGRFIHLHGKDDAEFYARAEEIKQTINIKVQTKHGISNVIWEN